MTNKKPDINKLIVESLLLYYKLDFTDNLPDIIFPYDDPNLACYVMDKVKTGSFKANVVYGVGEYFKSSVSHLIAALRHSRNFKEMQINNKLAFKMIKKIERTSHNDK